MNVLVDTSIWSLSFRRKSHNLSNAERLIVGELTELISEGRTRLIGPIRQELLSGIKVHSQYEKLRITLFAFLDEPINTADYETAARINNECRAKGISAGGVDALICAIALARKFAIFSTDPDFQTYSKLLPLQLHSIRKRA